MDIPAPVSTATRRPCSSGDEFGGFHAFEDSRLELGCGTISALMLRFIIFSAASPSSASMCATASRRHDHLEVPDVGVERGVEDALFGDLPGEDEPFGSEPAQQVVQ